MKKLLILILSALILFITGCRNSACYTMLEMVDSLTEKDFVDSASKIIKKVEATYYITDDKERAYYELLKSQLAFRNGCKEVKDNILNYSISYYTQHDDKNKLALCYYLKGRMSTSKNAIKYLKNAEFIVEKTDNDFLKMRIYNSIACINLENEDYAMALKYGLKALSYQNSIADKEYIASCLLTVSSIYGHFDKEDSAIIYIEKCLPLTKYMKPRMKSTIYVNIAAYMETADTIKARKYAWKAIDVYPTNNAYQILASLSRKRKDYASAEVYLNEALKLCTDISWEASIIYELSQVKKEAGEYKDANDLYEKAIDLYDSINYVRAQDSIKEIQIAADHEHRRETEISRKDDRAMAGAAVMMLVIVAVCTAYTVKRYRYRKSIDTMQTQARRSAQRMERKTHSLEKKAEKYRQEIKEFKEKSREKDKEISSLDAKIKRIEERHDVLLAKKKQADEERMRTGMEVYDALKRGDKVSGWTKEKMECLVMFFTFAYPDVMKTLTERHGTMTEYRCTQLIMKHLGLTTRQISEQFGITGNAVRAMMSRKK